MPDLRDVESVEIQGSARLPYVLKSVGGVFWPSAAQQHAEKLIGQKIAKGYVESAVI